MFSRDLQVLVSARYLDNFQPDQSHGSRKSPGLHSLIREHVLRSARERNVYPASTKVNLRWRLTRKRREKVCNAINSP